MKKIFSVIALAIIFSVAPVQAQSDFNRDFNSQIIFMSNVHNGRVFGVSNYLVMYAEPNEYSEEVMRIPNGAELLLRDRYISGWWEVISVEFGGKTYSNTQYVGDGIGWISTKFVKIY